MEKFVITGGNSLHGHVSVSGAKNVALKALVAACLTDEEVILHHVPLISDVEAMIEMIEELGGRVEVVDHTVRVRMRDFKTHEISLDRGARVRTSAMLIAPLLARYGEAIIPNPGGCRLGARPIDRTIDGVSHLGADITYHSEDGYFHAKTKGLYGTHYRFAKNTHTGTETLILTAVLARGETVLENAAEEPEIDDLIALLNAMGGSVTRTAQRQITIKGVEKLHGVEFSISPDRNEIVTFAIAAVGTGGDIWVEGVEKQGIEEFLDALEHVNGGYEIREKGIRFFSKGRLVATNITTSIYPGFMTDWQAPWAVLMTQAKGESVIHETVFENKMGYIADLKKMGARAELFNPKVENPQAVYNFNLDDDNPMYYHAVKITGPRKLHNAIVTMADIRAGAAVLVAALIAKGESTIFGIDKLDRGYEKFEERLRSLGAKIERVIES